MNLATLEFHTAADMTAHYRAVRARLPVAIPQWRRDLLALPQPGVLMLPVTTSFATVEDIVPSQSHRAPAEVARLSAEAERVAVRRSIARYFALLGRLSRTERRIGVVKLAVGHAFKVSQDGFTHHSRRHGVTRIRQIAMCLGKMLTPTSHNEIGRSFGGRDHTTVLHAYRKFLPLVTDVLAEMYDGQSCPIEVEQ
ncbi:helix-turn-helix domain-containing protein [Bradyrhizobium erythrophlei]|uniref:DnaA protein helix-turn-helix n=1 Tax=Bradyrhizobium erythrophlei TaxID=1437360 RepID=A0A1H4NKJ0_9BRAD|nr:dnaA protein helix-turn-helix [Bradyrhizobium erythrophlei]